MQRISRKNCFKLILTLMIFSLSMNVFYWSFKKEGFFIDELFSYNYICKVEHPKTYMLGEEYLKTVHTPSFYFDFLSLSSQETFDFKGIYQALSDSCVHPPLHYFFLNVVCSIFSINNFTKWTGLSLNVVFYILTLLVLTKIIYLLTKSYLYAIIGCLIYGMSAGAVSTVIYIRMYMMLTFATILLVYSHLQLFMYLNQKSHSHTKYKSFSMYSKVICSLLFGLLTHYYFIVFSVIYCFVFWCLVFFTKRKTEVIFYTVSFLSSFLVFFLIWPSVVNHLLFSTRGQEAFSNAISNTYVPKTANVFLYSIDNDLFSGTLVYFIIFSFILVLTFILDTYKSRSMLQSKALSFESIFVFLCGIAFISQILILVQITPPAIHGYQIRYIYNYYPLIILFLIYFFALLNRKFLIISFICIFLTYGMINNYKPYYLYTQNIEYFKKLSSLSPYTVLTITQQIEKKDQLEHELFIYYLKANSIYVTTYDKLTLLNDRSAREQIDSNIVLYVNNRLIELDVKEIVQKLSVILKKNYSIYDEFQSDFFHSYILKQN